MLKHMLLGYNLILLIIKSTDTEVYSLACKMGGICTTCWIKRSRNIPSPMPTVPVQMKKSKVNEKRALIFKSFIHSFIVTFIHSNYFDRVLLYSQVGHQKAIILGFSYSERKTVIDLNENSCETRAEN